MPHRKEQHCYDCLVALARAGKESLEVTLRTTDIATADASRSSIGAIVTIFQNPRSIRLQLHWRSRLSGATAHGLSVLRSLPDLEAIPDRQMCNVAFEGLTSEPYRPDWKLGFESVAKNL